MTHTHPRKAYSRPTEVAEAGSPSCDWDRDERRDRDHRFRAFWLHYRRRTAFSGLSLATVYAILGAQEARFSGHLLIRTDLDASVYLAVPFVRRSWRLLTLLDGVNRPQTETDRFGDTGDSPYLDDREPGSYDRLLIDRLSPRNTLSLSWEITNAIGMNPATARVNLSVLISVLTAGGFIDSSRPAVLTPRGHALVRHGSVGEFYKALVIRLFGRVPWSFDDGLPSLSFIQLHGLFLTYLVMTAATEGSNSRELAAALSELVYELPGTPPTDPRFWAGDPTVIATAIESRFLTRVGRMLGLVEEFEAPEGNRFRASPFARRVFRWQL